MNRGVSIFIIVGVGKNEQGCVYIYNSGGGGRMNRGVSIFIIVGGGGRMNRGVSIFIIVGGAEV